MFTRRDFSKTLAASAAGLALSTTAKSYARIVGSNERVNCATIGLNSRAYAHLSSLHANQNAAAITHVADVDTTILAKYAANVEKTTGTAPKTEQDFRKLLELKEVDAITIAAPDHWHTPMAILGMQAGKHVYVEKPCSHNLHEVDLLCSATKKYGKVVQMGNQQRSSEHTIEIIGQIHSGVIGDPYYAKAWYTNARKSIGIGKPAAVPATLNWDLWQGPAPRKPYKDNIHPYNWHWFHIYGTGETLNNGTHEVDICRWALKVDYPNRVTASGGRYAYKDDWEFYDTLNTSFEYDGKLIEWEGRCCNDMPIYNRERGLAVYGTTGAIIIDRDGYEIHDLKGKMVKEFKVPKRGSTTSSDLVGADSMTDQHFKNFLDAIKTPGTKLDSPIDDASKSVAILLMSNIAYDLKRDLKVNSNGTFVSDSQATGMRTRTYEKGWEPKV
jgi:predicted dehydrogenase